MDDLYEYLNLIKCHIVLALGQRCSNGKSSGFYCKVLINNEPQYAQVYINDQTTEIISLSGQLLITISNEEIKKMSYNSHNDTEWNRR